MLKSRCLRLNALIALALSITILLGGCSFPFGNERVKDDFVRVLDVGQGDCILISSNGRTALIDTATREYGEEIYWELINCGVKAIDVLLLTHMHNDHTGALPLLSDRFEIKNLILPELVTYSEGIVDAQYAVNVLKQSGGNIYRATQGMNFNIGEFEITILASYGDFDEINNHSLFVMAEIDDVKFMFSGDAEKEAEKRILEEGLNVDCDVFKAGHHGSSTSNTEEILKAMSPKYAAISCGVDNSYGHPHWEVIASFKEMGIKTLRTDTQGSITFYVDKGKLSATTEY